MATTPATRLTPARARRVGLELAGLLLVSSAVLAMRGHRAAATIWMGVLGVLLAAFALVRPSSLVPLAGAWMGLASGIARVTSPLFLGIVYLVVFTPMAWVRRSLGRSPIARDRAAATYWIKREARSPDAARRGMERQF